ncbi:MAG: flagellar hook-associated protein FlgK [Tissierellia bacterium]|nr:flagellar hook-associated protein FlgK [Tissierellia bacterium]
MDFGFNSAVQGLLASQKSLYVTSHNISNTNTKGYTRQQALQEATLPQLFPNIGYLGTGTQIYDIIRIRDSYVDFKYWNENAHLGEWSIKRETLLEIEKLFGEPSNSSFRKYLDDFYTSLEKLSTNPSDISYREPVVETAIALTKHINETAARLLELREDTRFAIEAREKNINSIAEQIASLNRQIYSMELDGRKANDLRDKRELLVDELSKIVNVRVNESSDGKYTVSISGISIVDHFVANKVNMKEDTNGNIVFQWENGSQVKLISGQLKGLLDLYNGDGVNNAYRGIPYYQKRLNEFAKEFAEGFNIQHSQGFKLDSTENGGDFFTFDEFNPAATITVAGDILNDLKNIAAAANSGGSAEDNGNLLALLEQRNTGDGFEFNSSPDDYIKSIISNFSVDSTQAKRMNETQEVILQNIESKRNSISGVSLDEEMANMIRFQNTYVAAARMITTMDEILEVTINRLGLVGR